MIDWLQEIRPRLNPRGGPRCCKAQCALTGAEWAWLRLTTNSRRLRRLDGGEEVDGEFVVAGAIWKYSKQRFEYMDK